MNTQILKSGLVAVFALVCAGQAAGVPIDSAGSGYWTNPIVWNPAQVPTIDDDVTILAGHTVTINTNVAVPVGSLTIRTNGVLTHLANGTTAQGERYKIVLDVVGNLTIDAGGLINANFNGYIKGQGPGFGPGYGNGGSHGGKGAYYAATAPGLTYGSITAPTNLGSGGGVGGYVGGGAVRLTAGGEIAVNGIISALGQDGAGGGAGGSIFLTAATLTGTGLIRANGGGGAIRGGGGRVAVVLTASTDFGAVRMQAYGGGAGTAAGTVYLEHTGHEAGQGRLIVDNNDIVPPMDVMTVQNGVAASSYAFSEIVLTNGGVYALDADDALDITTSVILPDPTDRNEGLYVSGTLTVPAVWGWTNYFIAIGSSAAAFNPATSLTVGTNATLKIDRPFVLNCPVALEPGGWLSHSVNGATDLNRMDLTIRGNLYIPAGGQVNVDGVGFARGQGPGGQLSHGTAGSHGGRGGIYSTSYGRPTFGSITSPTNCGSGGGLGYVSEGGGAARLTVGGTTTVNGMMSANGLSVGEGGGAGGSIFLTTGELVGDGTIRANGGNGNPSGGGGRIALIVTNDLVFGSVKTESRAGTSGTSHGAGGTLYLQHKDHAPGQGKLVVDFLDRLPVFTMANTMQNGAGSSSYSFSEIVLTNGAVYALDANDTLNLAGTVITGDPSDRNEGFYAVGGTLTVPAAFAFSNCFIAIAHANTVFLPATSLTVGNEATMRYDVPWTVDYPLTLEPGGWLGHSPNWSAELSKLDLVINGNLDIPAGAQVNVDGMGYSAGNGLGKAGSGYTGGAGYGGMGGRHDGDSVGSTYGSLTSPTNLGSGGLYFNGTGAGGGSARLIVNGITTVNGFISANGTNAYCSGSGGSVFLTTAGLAGTGTIRANGGAATGGGGGGGRLAIELTDSTTFGEVRFEAIGGGTTKAGAAGTISLTRAGEAAGQGLLVVDNAGKNPASTIPFTLISSNVRDTGVGTVIITNQARFRINTNQSLTVNGSWTNAGLFVASSNSTVLFAGAAPATVTGSNTFYNLVCTNAGKIVTFEAGRTNRVNGLFKLGTENLQEYVTLRSTVEGVWTYLMLNDVTGTQEIARVHVTDSNAGGGQLLMASKGSLNGGNTENWFFPKIGGTVLIVR